MKLKAAFIQINREKMNENKSVANSLNVPTTLQPFQLNLYISQTHLYTLYCTRHRITPSQNNDVNHLFNHRTKYVVRIISTN